MRSLLLVVAIAACSHTESKAPPTPAPAPASAPTTQGIPGSQDLAPLANLGARLRTEATHRPTVKVPAEKLFDALAKQGVTLATHHQVLATTANASYCDLGVTKDTTAIAVCEYPSHAAAEQGKHLLDTRYARLVPDAVRSVNGATLVTVAGTHHAQRDEVIHTFLAL